MTGNRPKLLPHVCRGGVASKQQLTESAQSGAGLLMSQLLSATAFQGTCPWWQVLVGGILGRRGNHCSHEINLWFITQRMGKGNWVTMTPQAWLPKELPLAAHLILWGQGPPIHWEGPAIVYSHLVRRSFVATSQGFMGNANLRMNGGLNG